MSVEELLTQARKLSFTEQLRLLEGLAAEIRFAAPIEHQLPWKDFIEQTAGSLADTPVERSPQGEYEVQDSIE